MIDISNIFNRRYEDDKKIEKDVDEFLINTVYGN